MDSQSFKDIQKSAASNPTTQSGVSSNQPLTINTDEVNFPIEAEEKPSNLAGASQYTFDSDQTRSFKENLEEEKTNPKQEINNDRLKFPNLQPQVLSPTNFPNMESPERNLQDSQKEESDHEGHRVYVKYFGEYQKKYPSDIQHLRVSKQLSSPEAKKSGVLAFRRICNNNSLGETVISEFTQAPIPDKESNSKSSKTSSTLVNPDSPENTETVAQPGKQNVRIEEVKRNESQRETTSLYVHAGESEADSDILRNSELEVLAKKAFQKIQGPTNFNVMIVGASGLGKSTFIDCFLGSGYNVLQAIRPTTNGFKESQGTRTFRNSVFKITFIDSEGFKDTISLQDWYRKIRGEITSRFDDYKAHKDKPSFKDRRIHLMLYFLGEVRIKSKDIQIMKKLQKYCSILPVLAKGDCYTIQEILEIKQELINKQERNKLEWFDLHTALQECPEKLNELNTGRFGPCPPFLIISSVNKVKISSHVFAMGREYMWGTCNIENPNHSDFKLLQSLLGGFICHDATKATEIYYSNYREAVKKKEAQQKENEERNRNIGIGAFVMFGLLGMFIKKKYSH